MEPFCRGVFGSRSSVPSQCVAELRTTSLPEPPCVRAVPTTRRIETGACVDCFPVPRGLPRTLGGSASALSFSRPAQASLALRPARLLNRPSCRRRALHDAAFVTGLRRGRLPSHPARQLPAQSTTRWVEPSSTGVSRPRGAPEIADICVPT
jgi:hypothetical protein